ncbi:urate oxidase [Oratosquilla oratoria]|uniref:urate oxidase n=1 Tax=Oratosquilla oratoria TaxID=337810 RepID=UPI003F76F335
MASSWEWVDRGYGKNNVRLLHITRDGSLHRIHEFEVDTQIRLDSDKDYTDADNSDIIATDTQKNTVYILAKNHGIQSPEQFAMLLCAHFLKQYDHVNRAKVFVKAFPWRRMVVDNEMHNHAFVAVPEGIRTCTVTQHRGGIPQVSAALEDLRVLKTTQSAFTNFYRDEYRSLPDVDDRVFSTTVAASWDYSTIENLDFDEAWLTVKQIIVKQFAGPAKTGVFSPSVQQTLHFTQLGVLDKIPQVDKITITMPNSHYFNVDLSKFPEVGSLENNEVLMPVDKPSGNITATLGRGIKSKL